MYVNGNKITYFDSLGLKHIPKEIKNFIGNTNIITNIYRIQAYDSVICGYSHVWFIDFLLKGKSLLDTANLLSPNDYQKNNTKIFSAIRKMKNPYCVICGKYKKFEKPIITYIFEKTLVLPFIRSKCKNGNEAIWKGEESIEILKFIGLMNNTEKHQKIYNHVNNLDWKI